jgi:subtilase family serine protease
VIYNVTPLYQQLTDGSGQSIAIVGRTNIHLPDVRTFRSTFGLPPRDPQVTLNGPNPGIVSQDEEVEAALDVEWSGAVAKNANIKFVVSASTNASDGVYLSAQYIVNHNLAQVMSVSFGLCEDALGSAGNSFLNSLWQQAAAEGITVFVSSGDSGAAGCDYSSARTATHGRGVNGLCSPGYSVCVGGTQFNDTDNPSLYWSSLNASNTLASALSYIPETVWNESGSSGLWSGGGGASSIYKKPSWQSGPGVPGDGKRDVPDVSLSSAIHDGYLVYMEGGLMLVGGTSAASPSLAGLMALVLQTMGSPQGNANPAFYALAARQSAGGPAVFHDIAGGNNTVAGVTGFNAGLGYDLASGLGSVDAFLLVTHWGEATAPAPGFQLSAAQSSAALTAGAGSATVGLSVNVSGGFNAPVGLSVTGLPAGVTATFSPDSLAAPGSGSSVLTLTASANARAQASSLIITAAGGGATKTAALNLTVSMPAAFNLTASANSITVVPGKSGVVTYNTTLSGPFRSAVSLTLAGLPAGVAGTFSPLTIASPGSGQSKLALKVPASISAGSYALTVTASGGGMTRSANLTLNIPGFSLSVAPATISVALGGRPAATLTTNVIGGFNSTMSFSISGLPAGVTRSLTSATLPAPGSGSSTLTLTRGATARAGTYTLTVTASGGGMARTVALPLTLPAK